MTGRVDEVRQTQDKAVKRRGLIAGAAALVVGIMAKQTAQPVAAHDGQDLGLGSAFTNSATTATTLTYTGGKLPNQNAALLVTDGTVQAVTSSAMVSGVTDTKATTGLYGQSSGVGVAGVGTGVLGLGNGVGVQGNGNGVGVIGASTRDGTSGVVGFTNNAPLPTGVAGGTVGTSSQAGLPGVYGYNSAAGKGVLGVSFSDYAVNGYVPNTLPGGGGNTNPNTVAVAAGNFATGPGSMGVLGLCDAAGGVGVKGSSAAGFPIIGNVTGTGSAANTAAGVLGSGTKGPGVQGQSTGGHGLVGTTDAADGHAGLIGNANNAGGIGLMGIAPGYNTASVGKAGEFFGNVAIHGAVQAPSVQAVAQHPADGTYRALPSVVSPEHWAEDFGRGTLAGGRAEVRLDADFAALVHADDYHVFAMPEGPLHLHVEEQTATGFTVVGMPLAGATAGGPKAPTQAGAGKFSWRVVAKRKDAAGERLAKVAGPPPAPTRPAPFAIPESPKTQEPVKKP